MEVLQMLSLSPKNMSLVSSSSLWSLYLAFDFMNPVFLRSFSSSLHLVLLLALFLTWVAKKFRTTNHNETGKYSFRNPRLVYFKGTLLGCLCLAGFNLLLCFLNHFYWYRTGWSDEKIVILVDLSLKTISWSVVSIFLYNHSRENNNSYPLILRVWWVAFFFVSCYCLVIDSLCYKKHQSLSPIFWVSDIVSTLMGLCFCLVGFLGRKEEDGSLLQEPLLNGTTNGTNNHVSESKKFGEEQNVTPYASANIVSILSFSWMGPLISLGNKKTLDLEDVPQLTGLDSVRQAFPILNDKLESVMDRGTKKVTTLMLVKGLIATVWKEIVLSAVFVLLYTLSNYVGPYLIDTFVQFLNGRKQSKKEGYLLVSAFFGAKIVECLAQRHWFFRVQQAGFRARAALVEKVYCKGLTLSGQSKQGQTSGEIINFMAVDAERIGDFGWYMHDPWMVILQVALALLILYKNLGLASLATLASTILVMLVNVPIGKLSENYQEELMKSKDRRMKAMSEVLRNMRILKLQAWEMKFLSRIQDLRNTEAGWLRKFMYTNAMASFVFWGAPTFVSVSTFGACLLMGIPLESGKILSALATFRILQEPIYNLPDTISMIIQTKVSLDRIASFLSLDDLPLDTIEKLPSGSSSSAIEIVDGNFSWDASSSSPTLRDININVSHGMRVAICGTVGAGKSSLLSCMLGEMPKLSGSIKLSGTKAYVAQSPWIQSGKIEENILFGKEMQKEKYDHVLEACSLKKDLEILAFGDQTVIGERGINLSGGQKQRIQIARALYQDADIYLFDDPFSAVDAHTGTHLFNECILGLLTGKTVVYVTHQVEFLPAADLILVMKDGKVAQAGKYDDILKSGTDFMELVGAHRQALSALDSAEGSSSEKDNEKGSTKNFVKKDENGDGQNGNANDAVGPKGQLVQEEEREKGKVGFPVYWKYITTACGGALIPLILLAHLLFNVLQIGSNYWMAWATPVSKDVKPPVTGYTLIMVYVILAVASSFCILIRALSLATAGYKTATILFNKMHFSLFRAPMSFFDATPSGRILNRASTDQSAVDLNIPYQVGAFAFSIIQLLGIIAVMSQVAWQVFVVFVPVIAICIWLQQYYISSARELSRLVGVCKAPVIQHFAETISGSSTIRSFDQESRFQDTSMKLIDGYSRPKFHTAAAMEWLCFRLDVLSLITFTFSLVFLISIPDGTIEPSVAGLAVTYGLNLNMLQAWVVWNICLMENKIISVERILQYMNISSEPPLVIESNRPDNHWPSQGEVDIRDLQVRYAPHMPLVLRGLTCTFFGGKKTGIVGRTGSGKSTLIQTLFRIVEPAAGQVRIDGVNISSIGLHDLRSRLSIIPQDPTMFEGTVRSNLDPLEEYSDEQIWEALDKCQLGDVVRKKEGKLDSTGFYLSTLYFITFFLLYICFSSLMVFKIITVSENGENWSVGQRQLVCLGRVLLKKSKVLVLDEATASVDTATDNLIQQTLRQHFTDSTVITIAHRITSVLDSDMVLLLDHGLIEEYDTPAKLLDDKTSSFAKLVAEYSMRSSSSFANLENSRDSSIQLH
ncbi:OLC1v1022538C1 [Oldenlandia corymbosa var. corymbosa]|uniref:ABC-type xenobiotic transporter n=1 Tax=Oldenlandia corymbosa var. corymbosa TaxID=529605 RepID=A0AAV1C0G4_OLDCO|nr:OLC1v1022538C1 [Oldenlandia corymbosa var. corymbosa]